MDLISPLVVDVGAPVGRVVGNGVRLSAWSTLAKAGAEVTSPLTAADVATSTDWLRPQADRLMSPDIKSIHVSMCFRPIAMAIALCIHGPLDSEMMKVQKPRF